MEKRSEHFIKFPTELLEALCRTRIAGEARMVLDVIIRKTIGFHKKTDWISLSQFREMTGLQKNALCRAINHLRSLKIIHVNVKGGRSFYSIEANTACWKPLPKKGIVSKKGNGRSQKCESSFSKKRHTVDNETVEIVTRDSGDMSPSGDISSRPITIFDDIFKNYEGYRKNR